MVHLNLRLQGRRRFQSQENFKAQKVALILVMPEPLKKFQFVQSETQIF